MDPAQRIVTDNFRVDGLQPIIECNDMVAGPGMGGVLQWVAHGQYTQ